MDYNENEFKAKANIKARRIWLVFALLLSANYGSDVSQGGYPSTNYIIFLILCWVPFFAGDLLLRIRGKADDRYRYALVIGYGIFYTFLICTTDSPIAFTYILPVVSLLPGSCSVPLHNNSKKSRIYPHPYSILIPAGRISISPILPRNPSNSTRLISGITIRFNNTDQVGSS